MIDKLRVKLAVRKRQEKPRVKYDVAKLKRKDVCVSQVQDVFFSQCLFVRFFSWNNSYKYIILYIRIKIKTW